jgi:hypothetical protein
LSSSQTNSAALQIELHFTLLGDLSTSQTLQEASITRYLYCSFTSSIF